MVFKNRKIFIAVSSYNEKFLKMTIENAIEMAEYPDRLIFGIFSIDNNNNHPIFLNNKNIKLIKVDYPTVLGVCSSRIGALFTYTDEDYFLQIDAHMLFQKK
jgi:hypothetical protein